MSTKTFNLSLPTALMKELDVQAKKDYASRSEFIRRAIINQLKREQRVEQIFEQANRRGKKDGYTSEQQIYDRINEHD